MRITKNVKLLVASGLVLSLFLLFVFTEEEWTRINMLLSPFNSNFRKPSSQFRVSTSSHGNGESPLSSFRFHGNNTIPTSLLNKTKEMSADVDTNVINMTTDETEDKETDYKKSVAWPLSSHAEDTQFLPLDWGPRKLLLYKVFWDDRNTTDGPFLRFLVAAEALRNMTSKRLHIPVFCYISCGDTELVEVAAANSFRNGYLIPQYFVSKGVTYHKFVLPCNISQTTCVQSGRLPTRASLGFWGDFTPPLTPANSVQVSVPRKSDSLEGELALCVTISYGNLSVSRLVEWLEIQRLLGVSKVIMWNDEIQGPALNVLDYYQKIGFVELRPSSHMFQDTYSDVTQRESFMHNDCMYSHLYQYRYFLMSGLDDVILPLDKDIFTIPELLAQIRANISEIGPATYQFKAANVIMEDKLLPNVSGKGNIEEEKLDDNLLYPHRITRTRILGGHAISIHHSLGCAAAFNHFCSMHVDNYPSVLLKKVPESVALDFHYRFNFCENSPFKKLGNITCLEKMKIKGMLPLVEDRTIDKYAEKLKKNVGTVRQNLGF